MRGQGGEVETKRKNEWNVPEMSWKFQGSSWKIKKHTYLNGFFGFFGLGHRKTSIFKLVFWVFWVLDPPRQKFDCQFCNFEVMTLKFCLGGPTPKKPKKPI